MSISASQRFSSEEKLHALRYLDEFRFWHSLNDVRSCRRCGRSITGEQVLVIEPDERGGNMRLQCPTRGCISSPADWVYADPMLAAQYTIDSSRSRVA
jgi:hypothetical protein